MSDLVLNEGQEKAMAMIRQFMASEDVVAVLTGYAGTGKTTMIKVVADEYPCEILAPTGKAALRVTEATGHRAQTIHRLLYKASNDEDTGETKFVARPPSDLTTLHGCIIIVDEASMVGKDVWLTLTTTAKFVGAKILLVGDTFQLPPVQRDDEPPFSALNFETPHRYALTDIVRQALDNPIVRASMLIRQNRPDYETLTLLHAISPEGLDQHIIELQQRGGVALCFTNNKRHELNAAVRRALGYEPQTMLPGEPLLVLRNNYAVDRYNGEVISFLAWRGKLLERTAVDRWKNSSLLMHFGEALIEGDSLVCMSPEQFSGKAEQEKIGELTTLITARRTLRDAYEYSQVERWGDCVDADEYRPPPFLFCTYGYTLTCHKSQGSEWPEVTVFLEPSIARRRDEFAQRWKYTAITRGKKIVNYTYL